MRFLCIAVLVACANSGGGGSRGAMGAERGDCRSADPKCEPGLLCLSNLCVRPPAADCTMVAETLASLDLGNYAEPEERAPVVAKYKTSCEKTYVSKEEGACIDKASDKWTAGQCAPRMFPEFAANKGDCKAVVARIENALKTQMQGTDPQTQSYLASALRVMQQSCEEDAWPDALKKCILTTQDVPGVDAMQTCNQQMPPALQAKLQERMQTAMREQMK